MSKNKSGKGKFILGALVGASLGILFAPKKGSETRKELKVKLDELVEQIKGIKLEDVKKEFNDKVNQIKADLTDLDKEKVLAIAKEKGNDLKEKAQDLLELAKEKGTPALKKTAETVLENVIKVSREALKKLEASEEK